jgi:hypothetical protein
MSEYQYYEFHAIDRPLSEKEQAEVGSLSSRAEVTLTHAVFTYNYGDFRGDPQRVLQKYFDAMLYLTNWGTKQLVFRLPRSFVDAKALAAYCYQDLISTSVAKDHIILDICLHDEEGGGWVDGEGWLSSFAMLRQDILLGDYRALHLTWLKAISLEEGREEHEELLEPPVPAGLKKLSAPLKTLVNFFEIDDDLIAVAAEASAANKDAVELDVEKQIAKLSEQERIDFLVKVARGDPQANTLLLKKLKELAPNQREQVAPSSTLRRKASELLSAAAARLDRRKEQERQKADKAKIKRLNEMAPQEPEIWKKVFDLIRTKQTKAYDEAVKLLTDLRELAQHLGRLEEYESRLGQIQQDFSSLSGLKFRLREAGLVKRQ